MKNLIFSMVLMKKMTSDDDEKKKQTFVVNVNFKQKQICGF